GAVDADPRSAAARRIGSHVATEQAKHVVDLVVVELFGKIAPVEAAKAIAAPYEVRKEALAGTGGKRIQWRWLAGRSVPAQVLVELRLAADRGLRLHRLLPCFRRDCACGPCVRGQQEGHERTATGRYHRGTLRGHDGGRVTARCSGAQGACRSGFSGEPVGFCGHPRAGGKRVSTAQGWLSSGSGPGHRERIAAEAAPAKDCSLRGGPVPAHAAVIDVFTQSRPLALAA